MHRKMTPEAGLIRAAEEEVSGGYDGDQKKYIDTDKKRVDRIETIHFFQYQVFFQRFPAFSFPICRNRVILFSEAIKWAIRAERISVYI